VAAARDFAVSQLGNIVAKKCIFRRKLIYYSSPDPADERQSAEGGKQV
jgi:hypothetical protein